MSLWSRIVNVLRGNRLTNEIDEELQSHLEEAIENGRDPAEARRAFGSPLRQREETRDVRIVAWLDSLRADAVFGWRQLKKSKITSAAAILSLALAIGACTSAFRLIDALLLRRLPITDPSRLYAISRRSTGVLDGKPLTDDYCAYPMFRRMRAQVKDQAELMAISYIAQTELTYGSDQETEKANQQYVSGWMFDSFGLRPTLGRLFTANDDVTPGAHPYAVLSHDYWTRRFGQDPKIIGRTFRMDNELFQIVGIAPEPFTGTEAGTVTDIFIPTMMMKHNAIVRSDYAWFRTFVRLKPGVAVEPVLEKLRATYRAFQEERVSAEFAGMPKPAIDEFLNQELVLNRAATGISVLRREYKRSLEALGALVALVLLIACANIANLMSAQAAARAREMALRVSIGAGRSRLMQLVLVESALLAFLAAAIAAVFAWWSAPFVVSLINPPDNPARLSLPADLRVLGFGLALSLGVTFLFGLAPALRASAVKPASALKGGEDPHSRRRTMHSLIAMQAAFCFLVLFVTGLFVATFDRLSHQPTGFNADRLLTVDAVASPAQPAAFWFQVAEHLRGVPGVETVAISEWPLMMGGSWNGFISVPGAPPNRVLSLFLSVSPGWTDAMRIPRIDGRDFRLNDRSSVAMVNETFAKQYFNGENAIGRIFERRDDNGAGTPYRIVGLIGDTRYRNMREPIPPIAYFPFASTFVHATFIVRTSSPNPLTLAQSIRQEVPRARTEFRVSNIRTQQELNQSHTVRERLLAMLALFFATVALLLAGVGLYGVLDYSVLQRRREIGIRMAIGAQAASIARLVTMDVFSMVLAGAVVGVALGMASVRYIETLFFQVKATDAGALALPSLAILMAALLAALPAVIHAVRIDPAKMLRAE